METDSKTNGIERQSNLDFPEDQPLKDPLVPPINLPSNPRNFYVTLFLGVIFMLLFSAYNTAQNMISEIYSQKLNISYLGNVTLMVIYVLLGSTNIFVGRIMDYLSFKWAMFIASWGYILFLAAGAVACSCESNPDASYCSEGVLVTINVICAFILGLLACIIWVAQVGYVSALCDENSKAKFFGVFWALLQLSQFLGNIVTAVLLGYVSHFIYFIILLIVAVGSALLFLLLPHVEKPPEQGIKKPMNEKIKDFFKYFKVKEMQIFSVFCCFSGIVMGFYTGFLYKIIKDSIKTGDDVDENQKTAYVFICLGVFEFIGGMFNSYVGDKMNKYVMGSISTLLVELALFFSIIAYYEKSYLLCFFAAAGWGAGECVCNSIINAILTTDMGNKIECFAMYKFTQGIGVLIALALSVLLDGQSPFIYLIIMSIFQIAANLSMVYLKNNIKKFD